MTKGKRKNLPKVDPDFLEKQKSSLMRKNRQVLYFNDKEVEAIEEYCSRFKVSNRSALYRQAIMETILTALDENHPKLF